MKNGKKCWKMKSLAGIILTCIFLTACGEETKELMTGNDELKILEEVEFLPAQGDSLSYLFMTFEKDGTGWTIRSYGLEK